MPSEKRSAETTPTDRDRQAAVDALQGEITGWIDRVAEAIAGERERGARIAEDTGDSPPYDPGAMRHLIAQRIRECADHA